VAWEDGPATVIGAMNPILLKMQREGLLDEQAAQGVDALVAQGKPLDEALLSSRGLPEDRLLRYLSEEFHVPCVDLDVVHPDRAFLSQFPARILLAHRLLPVSQTSRPAHRPWAWPRPWAKTPAAWQTCHFRRSATRKVLKFASIAHYPVGSGVTCVLKGPARSGNAPRQAAAQFCRWAVREGRMHANPLVNVAPLNVRTDRRHDRRALALDECRRLLTATAAEPTRFGMTGAERALLYRVALTTGLRRGELASLTRASFDLAAVWPTVTVAAAYSKHRREDVLALRPDVADALRGHLALKALAAAAFNMPPKRATAPMFRADLKAAGIDYRDDAGDVADFHALRHTFITHLARSGVHPKVAQALARHSTITLTMDRYTHTILEDRTAALAALPDLGAPAEADAARRTGTDDRPASGARGGAREGGLGRTSANAGERQGELSARKRESTNPPVERRQHVFCSDNGGEGGIRTPGTQKGHAGFRNRSVRPLRHLSATTASR